VILRSKDTSLVSPAFSTNTFAIRFDEYRYHVIQHLISVTAKHWDKSMRVLASKALHNLVSLDSNYFIENALPYLVSIIQSIKNSGTLFNNFFIF
jgi:hypothetical protein